jgi:hypothetical protein
MPRCEEHRKAVCGKTAYTIVFFENNSSLSCLKHLPLDRSKIGHSVRIGAPPEEQVKSSSWGTSALL